jgi:hypothetical protein
MFDAEKIAIFEQSDLEGFRKLTLAERGQLLSAACRDAAQIEASKVAMGLPPSQPAPWPASTWQFLAEAACRVRGG